MNENAQAWVAALRSGEYQQATGYLTNVYPEGNRHCCLGVACELAYKAGILTDADVEITSDGHVTYLDERCTLPDSVQEWLGLHGIDGSYVDAIERARTLTADNDGGENFNAIAAIIESEPEGLFA